MSRRARMVRTAFVAIGGVAVFTTLAVMHLPLLDAVIAGALCAFFLLYGGMAAGEAVDTYWPSGREHPRPYRAHRGRRW